MKTLKNLIDSAGSSRKTNELNEKRKAAENIISNNFLQKSRREVLSERSQGVHGMAAQDKRFPTIIVKSLKYPYFHFQFAIFYNLKILLFRTGFMQHIFLELVINASFDFS